MMIWIFQSRDYVVVWCWNCKARTTHYYDKWGSLICVNCGEKADA